MGYKITLNGTYLMAVQYSKPGSYTKRSSSGMKRWSARQEEWDKEVFDVPGLTFVQWLKLLREKRLLVDNL